MLVLTCHQHVARVFHEAGGHVRTFADPRPIWGRAPQPRVAAPAVALPPQEPPAPAPVVVPAPLRVPSPDVWPAEAFFFGPNPGYSPTARNGGESVVRAQPAASALRPPRRLPRRHAARPRNQRR
jgi:hypothetical protein